MEISNRRDFIKAFGFFITSNVLVNSTKLKANSDGLEYYKGNITKLMAECDLVRKEWVKKFSYSPKEYLHRIQFLKNSNSDEFIINGFVITQKEAAIVVILSQINI